LVSTNLSILNKGNEPTSAVSNRKEVIDLTLGTDKIGDLVTNWHVCDEISFSHHRYIVFQVGDLEVTRLAYRNPKRTNWESYWEDLKVNVGVVPRVIHTVRDVELAVDLLQQAILSSYLQNCPARVAVWPRMVLSGKKS
jgi:methionine synthase II (cobalamin-independent)